MTRADPAYTALVAEIGQSMDASMRAAVDESLGLNISKDAIIESAYATHVAGNSYAFILLVMLGLFALACAAGMAVDCIFGSEP